MVNVKVQKRSEEILDIVISGHADSTGAEMMDLVCAEVSAVSVGALNSIDLQCPDTCILEMDKGYVHIKVLRSNTVLQAILKTICIQLDTIAFTNSQYVRLEKVEV